MALAALFPALSIALCAGACAGDTLVIELRRVAPPADPDCGAPIDARTLLVTALGDFPASEATARSATIDSRSGSVDIASFPATTRVLQIEVLGSGGALRTIGKTMPFDLSGELGDGNEVSVFMAPPLGVCMTGPPLLARTRPLMARAGRGALIAGGVGPGGSASRDSERYHPDSGRFERLSLALYGTAEHGLLGASMTALGPAADRVVIAGGPVPAYQVYDAATGELSAELFLGTGRAHHAAAALDEHRVLVAGGCAPGDLDSRGACMPGAALLSTAIIDVSTERVSAGPALLGARIGGVAVQDSDGAVLLIGGVDASGAAVMAIERVPVDGSAPGRIIAAPASSGAVLLASGSLFGGFAPGDTAARAAAAVLPSGADAVSPTAAAPVAMSGATMTALEDGRVLIAGELGLLLYEPSRAGFLALDTNLAMREHAAVRLDDGSVLLLGGQAAAAGSAAAGIFRPELIGPFSSGLMVSFGDIALAQHVIPRDHGHAALVPARGELPAHYLLRSSDAGGGLPSEWAVLAGPVVTDVEVSTTLRSSGAEGGADGGADGGAAVLLGFRDPRGYAAVVLISGQPAALYLLEQGVTRVACSGEIIAAGRLQEDRPTRVDVAYAAGRLAASLDGELVISCDGVELPAGLVGIGVVGPAGAELRVNAISMRR